VGTTTGSSGSNGRSSFVLADAEVLVAAGAAGVLEELAGASNP
jgi:hypothetical protein